MNHKFILFTAMTQTEITWWNSSSTKDSRVKTEWDRVENRVKSLREKKREDVQIKRLITAPCEAI